MKKFTLIDLFKLAVLITLVFAILKVFGLILWAWWIIFRPLVYLVVILIVIELFKKRRNKF